MIVGERKAAGPMTESGWECHGRPLDGMGECERHYYDEDRERKIRPCKAENRDRVRLALCQKPLV